MKYNVGMNLGACAADGLELFMDTFLQNGGFDRLVPLLKVPSESVVFEIMKTIPIILMFEDAHNKLIE